MVGDWGGEDLFSHGVLAEQGGHHRQTLQSGPGEWYRYWRTLIRSCKGGNSAYKLCLGPRRTAEFDVKAGGGLLFTL